MAVRAHELFPNLKLDAVKETYTDAVHAPNALGSADLRHFKDQVTADLQSENAGVPIGLPSVFAEFLTVDHYIRKITSLQQDALVKSTDTKGLDFSYDIDQVNEVNATYGDTARREYIELGDRGTERDMDLDEGATVLSALATVRLHTAQAHLEIMSVARGDDSVLGARIGSAKNRIERAVYPRHIDNIGRRVELDAIGTGNAYATRALIMATVLPSDRMKPNLEVMDMTTALARDDINVRAIDRTARKVHKEMPKFLGRLRSTAMRPERLGQALAETGSLKFNPLFATRTRVSQ